MIQALSIEGCLYFKMTSIIMSNLYAIHNCLHTELDLGLLQSHEYLPPSMHDVIILYPKCSVLIVEHTVGIRYQPFILDPFKIWTFEDQHSKVLGPIL